jgi:hypothetical protein
VIPEVIKMQAKKSGSMHNNAESQNYFSYSDSIHKKLAFVPFTKVIYKLEKPKTGVTIYFSRNRILVDSIEFTKEKLEEYIENLTIEDLYKCNFCFDKNDSYGNFVKNYVFATTLEVKRTQTDTYIY